MAFIPLPLGLRVAVEYTLNNQLVVNIYHVTTTLPINSTNLTALTNVFLNWWTNNQRQNFSASIALTRIVATDISVENGLQVVNQPASPVAGTLAVTNAPNNVAIVMSWRTGFSGRSFRGRSYYAGFLSSEVTDNLISGTLQTNLLADSVTLSSALATAGFTHVVASFFNNGAPRSTGVSTPITLASMDTRVDTQRRRLPGTGE